MASPALSAYFDIAYPPRTSLAGKAFFRHGEKERARILREWLPSTRGLEILDAGCGDGVFLRSILSGRPARIVCEDISARAVRAAERTLAGCADIVAGTVCDTTEESSGGFDVVLAIGMLDYANDWLAALTKLARRSNGVVIANVPRREHCRNWLRHLWFSLHGIEFHSVPQRQVTRGAASFGRPFALQLDGVDVVVIDGKLSGLTVEETIERAAAAEGDLIGITAMTLEFPLAAAIATALKSRRPTPIILGGTHANAVRDGALRECPAFDFVCAGEGEDLIRELVAGQPLRGIPGLLYRDGETIVANPPRPFRDDYDALPFPAWHLFPAVSVLPILTHRGCPFRCVFCSHNSGTKVRFRSVENTIAELVELAERHAPQAVRFEDETFGLQLERTKTILRRIIEHGLHRRMTFSAQTRVDCLDAEFMALLKAANFHLLELGVESGSDAVLKRIGKGITRAQAERAVRLAREAGLKVWCKFILGHPNESAAELDETVRFISRLNPDRVSVAIMTPYPGTPIFEMATKGEAGYRLLSSDWKSFDKYIGAALELESASLVRLKWLQIWSYLRLYLANFRFRDLAAIAFRHRVLAVQAVAGMVRRAAQAR